VTILRATTTDETAKRLASLRSRAELDVRYVLVLETDDAETANAHVRGPPGYRRLFVTRTFLDALDDDTVAALLAVQSGRVATHALEHRVGLVVVAAGVVVGFWLTRRGVRAAEDYAAARVGSAAVADPFERYAEVHAIEPSRQRVPNPLSATVPLGDRIDRLRE
jgi:STE24 endopeptidase